MPCAEYKQTHTGTFTKHIVSYGIANGKLANVVGFYSIPVNEDARYDGPWVSEVSRDEMVSCYVGWESEVQELIAVSYSPHEITMRLRLRLTDGRC